MFSSASECAKALRQITSHSVLLRQDKHVYSDILSESIPFVSGMTESELRGLSKSILIIHQKFQLNLNNYLFKVINKRFNQFIDNSHSDSIARHSLVSSMSSLSQIHRPTGDGGPPALRPDTVWKFAHSPFWRPSWQSPGAVNDKSELLTVMSRLNLRPFPHLVFASDSLRIEEDPNAIFFSHSDISEISQNPRSSNGRLIGSIHAMAKLYLHESPVFQKLVELIPPRIDELTPMELGNTLNALGVALMLAKHRNDLYAQISEVVIDRMEKRKHELPLSVVNQVSLFEFAVPEIARKKPFCVEATSIAERDNLNSIKSSKAQKVVRKALDMLGLTDLVKEEYPIGPFRIDFAFPELKLLIEINGPYHFYYKTNDKTTKTRVKHEALIRKGFRIIDIDYLEMKEEGNRVSLLDGKIREALNISDNRRSLKRELLNRIS